jgi:hypothetical protein
MSARDELRHRVRLLLGMGEQAERDADAVVALFHGVEFRDQDVDITAFSDQRRQLLRQRWIVAALPFGTVENIEGEHIGIPGPDWTQP